MGKLTEFREVRHVPELNYPMLPGDPQLEDGVLYVEDGSPFVGYNCPCGCGKVVILPTQKHQPDFYGWDFRESNGKVTLSPSVLSTGFDCKSHYFIRDNRIDWC